MRALSSSRGGQSRERFLPWLAGLCGGLVGLAVLKFGTAVIMERHIDWPEDGYEWALAQWPLLIGQGLVVAVAALAAAVARWPGGRHAWLAVLPLAWLVWQCVAATATVDTALTAVVLRHFAVCVVCFYLGYAVLGRSPSLGVFWTPVVVALCLMEVVGVDQRFRGLPETLDFLVRNEATHWRECPPEQVAEMERAGMLLRTPEGHTVQPGLLERDRKSVV